MIKWRKKLFVVNVILIVLTLAFIWGNSLDVTKVSASKSENVKVLVEPVLEHIVGEGNVTDILVRKLAHIVEFAVLGNFAMLVFYYLKKNLATIILFGLTVAVIDETIQLYSNRGSQVQDIWVDMLGFITGVLLMSIIIFIKEEFVKNK